MKNRMTVGSLHYISLRLSSCINEINTDDEDYDDEELKRDGHWPVCQTVNPFYPDAAHKSEGSCVLSIAGIILHKKYLRIVNSIPHLPPSPSQNYAEFKPVQHVQ